MKKVFRCACLLIVTASGSMAATQSWRALINGVWATSAVDPTATNWNNYATWVDGNDASFGQGGTVVATISNAVSVRSISTSGGQNLWVTNGVLNLGAGGLISGANNNNFKVFSVNCLD